MMLLCAPKITFLKGTQDTPNLIKRKYSVIFVASLLRCETHKDVFGIVMKNSRVIFASMYFTVMSVSKLTELGQERSLKMMKLCRRKSHRMLMLETWYSDLSTF